MDTSYRKRIRAENTYALNQNIIHGIRPGTTLKTIQIRTNISQNTSTHVHTDGVEPNVATSKYLGAPYAR